MGYGKVSKVQVTDNTITLSVDLGGFDAGSLVEISGNATQDNGAVTTFYAVQAIPADSSGEVTLPVVSPVQPNTFEADSPVTVVARAAAVWVNTLNPDTSQPMAWKLNSFGPALYLPPQQP